MFINSREFLMKLSHVRTPNLPGKGDYKMWEVDNYANKASLGIYLKNLLKKFSQFRRVKMSMFLFRDIDLTGMPQLSPGHLI